MQNVAVWFRLDSSWFWHGWEQVVWRPSWKAAFAIPTHNFAIFANFAIPTHNWQEKRLTLGKAWWVMFPTFSDHLHHRHHHCHHCHHCHHGHRGVCCNDCCAGTNSSRLNISTLPDSTLRGFTRLANPDSGFWDWRNSLPNLRVWLIAVTRRGAGT